jgi:radical SAM protein with 4Fe4S-binding SPASM domain
MSIKEFYNKGFNYLDRSPYFIEYDKLTDDQKFKLTESKYFCMMPWVHMHAYPDGRVYPCCLADYWHPVGDLRKNTMIEVWNNEKYKELRRNMLNEKPSEVCKKCYEQESNGFFSMRYDSNRNYGHHVNEINSTSEAGYTQDFKIRYWDIRFSNLCNFRCRTCGPIFSSNWYNDYVKMYNKVPDVLGRDMERIEYTAGNEQSMLEQMEPHIPYLEQVYFAGGEPLIMKEHYYLLEKLIEYGKTDVRIQYNTNFSELSYKDKHVFDYWKHFKNVSVGASLDASGKRAELMRKGTIWKQTVANRQLMMEKVPHVDFYIAATISAMNVLHILDFHKEWVELGLVKHKDFNFNICQGPDWYRIDIFPEEFKLKIIKPAYEKHLEWLAPHDDLERATNGYCSAIKFMMKEHENNLLPKFVEEVDKLDHNRSENFWNTFPELGFLKHDAS